VIFNGGGDYTYSTVTPPQYPHIVGFVGLAMLHLLVTTMLQIRPKKARPCFILGLKLSLSPHWAYG
jgi:hypothetical protein